MLGVVVVQRVGEPQVGQALRILLIGTGPARLDLYAAQALLDFLDDVVHAQQVLVDLLELALRLLLALLELGDAGGLLEDEAALFRVGLEQCGDAALLDHTVRVHANAGVQEKLANVFESGGLVVELVFAGAVAVEAAADADLVDVQIERAGVVVAAGVVEDEGDFGDAGGLAPAAAVEDHVQHRVAAQAFGALLAEHPFEAVHDVALATAVGADDAGDRRVEDELRPVGEALEPVQNQLLQSHRLWASMPGTP